MNTPEQKKSPPEIETTQSVPTQSEPVEALATREELARVAQDLHALSGQIARERIERRALEAIRAVRWFDPAEAARELLPDVREEDGALYVAAPAKDGEAPKRIPLAEAVAELAKRKPYWVKADLHDGSGAQGAAALTENDSGNAPADYRALLAQPKRLAELLRRDPAAVARLRAEHDAKRNAR